MKVNDATAFYTFGTAYLNGDNKMEVSRDQEKGLPFLLRAGELGSAKSYHQLAYAYMKGYGVEKDEKKARHYFELAAIGGNVGSRHNLGVLLLKPSSIIQDCRWIWKFFSLKVVKQLFMNGGLATREDYQQALSS
jgi:TPR repeat protein